MLDYAVLVWGVSVVDKSYVAGTLGGLPGACG